MPTELLLIGLLFLVTAAVSGYCVGVERERDRKVSRNPLQDELDIAKAALRRIKAWRLLRTADYDMPIEEIEQIAREGLGEAVK